MWIAGCAGGDTVDTSADDSAQDTGDDTELERWTGIATVRVIDGAGEPVSGVFVMMGGAAEDEWIETDADGLASIDVTDDGITRRVILAGAEGWLTGGVGFDQHAGPDGVLDLVMHRLSDLDGVDYAFQPGGNSASPDTTECGHCHWTIADDWAGSSHRDAARNPRVWDLYVGARSGTDGCSDARGWLADGQAPGEPGATVERCYLGDGVLPWLHTGCGGPGEPACDHPSERGNLQRFGSCADCHGPAVTAGIPGEIDLAALDGLAFDEGVACDFCHKIRAVTPGPTPGLDGGIQLHRPSQPTSMAGQQYDPINFGPYADVVVPIMRGSWVPQFRESGFCASCHEYAQPALHPDEEVDASRWPDGVPVLETWSEYEAAGLGATPVTCQTCHMGVIDEDSSTYDLSAVGFTPSIEQGWLRESGEVRHHHFARIDDTPAGLSVQLTTEGGRVRADVRVNNGAAGHAIPTGEPLRQLIVLVSAETDAGPVSASSGHTAPDTAGYAATGVVGATASVAGSEVQIPGATLPTGLVAARFVRATGAFDDYAGPGVGWFSKSQRTPEEKGAPIFDFVDEVDIVAVNGDSATLARVPTAAAGDVVFLVAAGQWAGRPGQVYAKTLVDAEGRRGVPHFRAVGVASDNRLGVGSASTTTHWFPASDLPLRVTARLVYRRYAAIPAATYGWDTTDVEVATVTQEQ